ncbi:MAG: hypothetical protein AAF367_01310 [Pseudomonadota bacterium]
MIEPPVMPPLVVDFPQTAFAWWEGQGQSNMTGFNEVGDAPAPLRVLNPAVEMMTDAPGWRPYGLLASGESADLDGVTYEGKLDEADIPPAAGGAGPLIGVHEAIIDGDMSGPDGLYAAGVLMAKFSDAGKNLDAFMPDYDDGSAPLGGVNFNARAVTLPGTMRARLAAGEAIFLQGKVWLQGETDAAEARASDDLSHPSLANYAMRLAQLRAFERAQVNIPDAPWYFVTIAEQDEYAAAINDSLAALSRWRVGPDGVVSDLGAGRDETSYVIDHMIIPNGDVHFSMTQMRAIGALVWAAHQHLAGGTHGLTDRFPLAAVLPVWQKAPEAANVTPSTITVEATANEDGTLHVLALPTGSPAPDATTIIGSGTAAAGQRGRIASVIAPGLSPDQTYDIWSLYLVQSGEMTPPITITAATEAEEAHPPTAGWSPADAGILSWWDAQTLATLTLDGAEVTGWTDKSPSAVTVTASETARRPILNPVGLNGLPAVDFNGDDDLEGVGAALHPDMCLLLVAEVDLVTNGSEALLEFRNTNLAIRAQNGTEFRARYELMNGVNTNLSPSPVVDYKGAPHLFLSRYDSAADEMQIWIDGTLVGSKSTYSIDLAATDDIRLMRPFGTALRLDGKLGEVVAIASADQADRERLEGYAAHRWGLAENLPANHPWKSEAP